MNDSNSSKSTNFSIDPLIEGSLEYRELKRLYSEERKAKEEWKKDYKVLKQQLTHLQSTTIRECNIFLLHLRKLYILNQRPNSCYNTCNNIFALVKLETLKILMHFVQMKHKSNYFVYFKQNPFLIKSKLGILILIELH